MDIDRLDHNGFDYFAGHSLAGMDQKYGRVEGLAFSEITSIGC